MTTEKLLDVLQRNFVREGRVLKLKIFMIALLSTLPIPKNERFNVNRKKKLQIAEKRERQVTALTEYKQAVVNLNETSLCIDLGANVGKISEIFASTGAEVHCYEPDPWSFKQLQARLGALDNVFLYQAAVGISEGNAVLHRAKDFDSHQQDRSLGSSIVREQEGDGIVVDVHDIRSIIKSLDRPVDILKIDIEGAEIELLHTLLDDLDVLDRVKLMFVETHETFGEYFLLETEKIRSVLRERNITNINLDWV